MALDQVGLARRVHADRDIGLAHREVQIGVVDSSESVISG
jgi:hypothetical protein